MSGPKKTIDRVFHALGDSTRRAILDQLATGPRSVSRLAGPLALTLTAVGQHLQILEDCGLVRTEKIGRVRSCRIDPTGFSTLDRWIQMHRALWDRRLDQLGKLLDDSPDEVVSIRPG